MIPPLAPQDARLTTDDFILDTGQCLGRECTEALSRGERGDFAAELLDGEIGDREASANAA